MTALSAERNTPASAPGRQNLPTADNIKLYKGALAMMSGGYSTPGATATGKFGVGRSLKTYDNTVTGHALGALVAEIEEGFFWWANGDAIAQADLGKVAYIVDDQTVSKAGAGKSPAGVIRDVDSSRGVLVEMSMALSQALAVDIALEATPAVTAGSTTLVAGLKTVNNAAVTATSKILVSRTDANGSTALGLLEGGKTIVAGTSFTIAALKEADGTTQTNDVSKVDYLIVG